MSDLKDDLKSALLTSTFDNVEEGERIAVNAEDAQGQAGINFSDHFFEPEVGSTYLIKLLPNPGGDAISIRSTYKKLPDPTRKGKSFHYISSGNSNTCKALELFFELHAKKKDGDAVAEKKIDKYMGRSNEGCIKIQVLQSPKQEEIGIVRLLRFTNYGPSTIVADLIDEKLNPTKEKIAQGFEREDIFSMFESSALSLVCKEKTFEGGIKGRDYSGTAWAPKKLGAIAILDDGSTHQFVADDVAKINANDPEITKFFTKFAETLTNEDYSTYKYFGYRELGDKRNSEEDEKYLKSVYDKVDEIIPIIRDKSLAEIANYGKKDTSTSTGKTKEDGSKNVMNESLPPELANSVMDKKPEPVVESDVNADDDKAVADILAS